MRLEQFRPLGMIAIVLAVGAVLAGLVAGSMLSWLSLAVAVFLYFFLPGYAVLLHLDADAVERCIFAFPAGAIVVSLSLYVLNLFGIMLTRITVLAVIIAVVAVSLALLRKKKQHVTS